VLNPEEFELFSRLRDLRKKLADREEVPVYAILTNAHLAEIVRNRVTTREGLSAIKGVGERGSPSSATICWIVFGDRARRLSREADRLLVSTHPRLR